MSLVTADPRPERVKRRPPNGSRRGKRAFIVYALILARPDITRRQLKTVLEWDDDELGQALDDLQILVDEVAGPAG